ncbi:MAG: hypothetical protein ACYTFG_19680, partial [Planctomycetota bacterium]
MSGEDERFEQLFQKADVRDADPGFADRLEGDLPKSRPVAATPQARGGLGRFLALGAAAAVALAATVYTTLTWDSGEVIRPGGGEAVEGTDGKSEKAPEPGVEGKGEATPAAPAGQRREKRESTDEPGGGGGEVERGGEEPARKGFEVPLQFHPPRRMREKIMTLMELIKASDVILAGRFIEGGHGSRFVADEVLKGSRAKGMVKILTKSGMICPRPAVPRRG